MTHPGCADRMHKAPEQLEILELHETPFVLCNVKNKVMVVKRKHEYKDKKDDPAHPHHRFCVPKIQSADGEEEEGEGRAAGKANAEGGRTTL